MVITAVIFFILFAMNPKMDISAKQFGWGAIGSGIFFFIFGIFNDSSPFKSSKVLGGVLVIGGLLVLIFN
jgi:hypothetical protein